MRYLGDQHHEGVAFLVEKAVELEIVLKQSICAGHNKRDAAVRCRV